MDPIERLVYLNALLSSVESAWPRVSVEIDERIEDLIRRLVASEDAEARGAIKALQELLDLPATLKSERDQINAELSERDSAH
jgi:hypothetical protein